jgi:N-methylhydantoinase A
MPTRERGGAPSRRCARSGPTPCHGGHRDPAGDPGVRTLSRHRLNAYLQPEVSGYLDGWNPALTGAFGGEFLIVQSNGGVMSVDTAAASRCARRCPGPAAGVIAAGISPRPRASQRHHLRHGRHQLRRLADRGASVLAAQTAIDFGMVVRTPMIEITTIGAGGGSIAWVDKGGLLQVGPESAGSDPGPVCYGLGNDRPTVTDANVVLGRINPTGRSAASSTGSMSSRRGAPSIPMSATPLGLDVERRRKPSCGRQRRMAGAIRLVSIERGHDPKKFAAMPFGGGGALHAGALIKEVGLGPRHRAALPRRHLGAGLRHRRHAP